MTSVNIKHNIEQVSLELKGYRRNQIPFATKIALNEIAKTAKEVIDKQIQGKLHNPTNYTTRMMRIKYATKSNLTAQIKVKDSATVTKSGFRGPDKILGHLFEGGSRAGKGMEGLMIRAGVLPAGMFVVPGEAAEMDSNGNMQRRQIIQLLAYFRSFRESGYKANSTDKTKAALERRLTKKIKGATGTAFFVVRNKKEGGLHPGVWQRINFQRSGMSIKPILMFVSKQRYKKYFDLEDETVRVIVRDLDREFRKAYNYAIATAK